MTKGDHDRREGGQRACNRKACKATGATYWNLSTRAWYCETCANMINMANHPNLCIGYDDLPEEWKERPTQAAGEAPREQLARIVACSGDPFILADRILALITEQPPGRGRVCETCGGKGVATAYCEGSDGNDRTETVKCPDCAEKKQPAVADGAARLADQMLASVGMQGMTQFAITRDQVETMARAAIGAIGGGK